MQNVLSALDALETAVADLEGQLTFEQTLQMAATISQVRQMAPVWRAATSNVAGLPVSSPAVAPAYVQPEAAE